MSEKKKFIEKYDKVLFLITLIVVACICLFRIDLIIDFGWNYSNIAKLCNGEVIYKDVNIIITPLFFDTCKLLLNVFGQHYYVFKMILACISVSNIIILYFVYKELKINKWISLISINLLVYMICLLIGLPVYVVLAFNFILLALLLVLKREHNKISDKKFVIIISILAVLTFLSYQKMGAVFAFFFFIYECGFRKKKGIIELLKIGALCILGLLIFAIRFLISNNFKEFIDIAILGMKNFTQNIEMGITVKTGFTSMLTYVMIAIFYMLSVGIVDKKDDLEFRKICALLMIFDFFLIIIAYPIINDYHFRFFIYGMFITGTYMINNLLNHISNEKFLKKIEKIKIIVYVFSLIVIIVLAGTVIYARNIVDKDKNNRIINGCDKYKGIVFTLEDQNNMIDIINYLDEKKKENSDCKYLVVSDISNVISLYYGESHGYYDMPLKGNVGLNGEKELLEGLKDKEGYYLFVYKGEESEYIDCFQFLSELSDYVKANYNRIDELEYFDVYYGKKEIINENQ